MNVRFLSVDDVNNSKYLREGSKNLLLTLLGVCDTIALCGVLKNAVNTKYGTSISIDDPTGNISITCGTFNKKLRKIAEEIAGKFKNKNDPEIYLLVYANPYQTDRLYLNANYDNSVLEVDKKIFNEFHEMRENSGEHLMQKIRRTEGTEEEIESKSCKPEPEVKEPRKEISEKEVIELIKKHDKGSGVKIEDFPEIEDKIYEMIENGDLYEPLAGFVRVV